jgi:hypothetical protein
VPDGVARVEIDFGALGKRARRCTAKTSALR